MKLAQKSREEIIEALDEGLKAFQGFINTQPEFNQNFKSKERAKMRKAIKTVKQILHVCPPHLLVEHRMERP